MRPSTLKKLQEMAAKIDFRSEALSFRNLREAAERFADVREANSESTFAYLLKSAVQTYAQDVYADLPVIYPNLVTKVTSKRRSEVYSGLYRPAMPTQVDAGEPFQESTFKGFEREIRNFKYGHIETFERELFDDDMTGQIRTRSGNIGEGFRVMEEIYCLARLFGLTSASYDTEGVNVPASTFNSGSIYTTAIGNRPTSFALLTATTLQAAHIALRNIKDPLNRKFLVVPTVLVVSPDDEFNAHVLINSPQQSNLATSAQANMVNPLQGRYKPYASPYVRAKAWVIGDPKRGFVHQERDALEVVQENAQSGASFRAEVYAFRARERFEMDWIESRYCYQGNDGSVTS